MTKKLWVILGVVLISALALAACQGSPATEAPTQAPAVEQPTTAPEPTEVMEEPTEVMEEPTEAMEEPTATIRIWADDTRAPILSELTDEFLATYGVELIVEQVANIRDDFLVAAPAGEGPDIIQLAHDQAGQVIASGLLEPLDLGGREAEFTEVAIEGCTFDGVLYCLPYATENMGFFYNTDLVTEPPTTWEEVVTLGTQLQSDGTVTYGFVASGQTYDIFPLDTAFGGYIFGIDADGNYDPSDVGVDSPGMIAAGEWLSEGVASGFAADNVDWDTAHVLFETAEVPWIMAGPWALDRFRESGVPYGITSFPSGGRPFAGVQGFMVSSFSENPLLAQAFLTEFVATEDIMTKLVAAGNRPSAYVSVAETYEDPDLVALSEAGTEAVLMPAIPEMGSVWQSWGDAFTLIIQSADDPTASLETAAGQIRSLIGGAAAGMVNAPGSYQAAAGCDGDWDPACEATALTEGDDGLFTSTHALTAGDYEAKVAMDGGWTLNYGVDGVVDGDNYAFSLASDGTVTFTYDPETNLLDIAIE